MTDRVCLAFDTSNYTTSVCAFDGESFKDSARLLPVREGELGLRQSDAVFHHTRALPELVEKLGCLSPCAVGASDRPREAEGSYMPCFLVGTAAARSISALFGVTCLLFTHQQGHVAAAAWSASCPELLDAPFLAWHLSGGTTELLHVRPDGRCGVTCEKMGGTKDISAGQLLDRTGKRLGVAFPAGKKLDDAADPECDECFRARADGFEFSLSGMENKLAEMINSGADAVSVSSCALNTISRAVLSATENALKHFGDMPVLFSGGVSGSRILRRRIDFGIFPEQRCASDYALGVAILTYRAVNR